MIKRIIIGLLGISGAAILGTEAIAGTCVLRSASGTCKIWSGSVEGNIVTDSQGGVQQHPMINMLIHPTGTGLVACANTGKKERTSPGIQLGLVDLTTGENFDFAATVPITRNTITNGVASVTAFAEFSEDQKAALVDNCPNTGWTVVDALPCDAVVTIQLSNDHGQIDDAILHCTLNTSTSSCETLEWIQETRAFERREYQCTLQP
jgi:hypothetical protein